MKITYIEHSCFLLEFDNIILLFDYYNGVIPNLDAKKAIYVFSSHKHQDHFNLDIFQLLKDYPNVHYILSRDIKRKYNAKFFVNHGVDDDIYKEFKFIGANETLETSDLKVETLTSTDAGVAFIVTIADRTIYHAGDLNLWISDVDSESDNKDMTLRFEKEMQKIKNRHFDVAFLPLDPRQEEYFYLGFNYFMKNTDTDKAYAMHFWKDNSVIDRLKSMDCSETYRNKIADITDY